MQKFGAEHTERKLKAVEDYLHRFTTALSKQNFELVYFDAFAGAGTVDLRKTPNDLGEKVHDLFGDLEGLASVSNSSDFIEGSAKRALRILRPFSKYIFCEKDPARALFLQQLRLEHPHLDVTIEVDDANRRLKEFCANTNWNRTRAVVFLDPFGSQLEYETIMLLGKTKAVDLWYLFPSFLSIFRQISQSGKMTVEQDRSIRRVLGTAEWKSLWLKKTETTDLFGSNAKIEKQVDVDEITRFMINKMKADFPGGVLDMWLPLGPNGAHWYSLLFAWANPGERAALAGKLARSVMARS